MLHSSQQAEIGYSKASVNVGFEPSGASNSDWNISATTLRGNSASTPPLRGARAPNRQRARGSPSQSLAMELSFEELVPLQFAKQTSGTDHLAVAGDRASVRIMKQCEKRRPTVAEIRIVRVEAGAHRHICRRPRQPIRVSTEKWNTTSSWPSRVTAARRPLPFPEDLHNKHVVII